MERRHLTLMFTDIVGYSRLMGQNEHQTIGLVDEYRRILLSRIQEFNGSVIEFIGDAVFASFDLPLDAVNAGMAIQNDLQQFNEHAKGDMPPLRTRIGIHTGEVTLKDGAPFGDDVNIAARLEPLAVADGICISEPVYQAIKADLHAPIKALGVRPLKNIDSKHRAYLIRPKGITYSTHLHYAVRTFQQKIDAYRYPLAIALVCLIAAGFYLVPRWLVPGYTANYVEIADFKNLMSEGGEADYFSAGITEALRSQLADMEDVYILDPSKGVRGPVRLEGSVQRLGDSLRIAYRLFRRKDNVQIAGGKLDGAYGDIFILQDRVVAEVGRYLADEFQLKFFRPAALSLTSDVTAYDYYLKGMEYLRMPETQENFDQAIKLFSTSLVHDNSFAEANAGICRAYHGRFKATRKSEFIEKAEEYCNRALLENDTVAQTYISLSLVFGATGRYSDAVKVLERAARLDSYDGDIGIFLARAYEEMGERVLAEKLFLSIIEAHPKNWRAYYDYSFFLIVDGRFQDAIDMAGESLKIIPENEPALGNLGVAYLYLGEFRKSAQAFEASVKVAPSSIGFSNAGTGYYYAEEYRESVNFFEKAIKLSPEDYRLRINFADALRYLSDREEEVREICLQALDLIRSEVVLNGVSTEVYQYRALAYLHLGEFEDAVESIEEALVLQPNGIDVLLTAVRVWTIMGDYDRALGVLKTIISNNYPINLLIAEPDLAPLRENHKYIKIVNSEYSIPIEKLKN
ncbi:MAG: tetratricopeptide repeat protein [Agarilytica sp.]